MFRATSVRARHLLAVAGLAATSLSDSRSRRTLQCDYAPLNQAKFPSTMTIHDSQFKLVSSGTRKVTFIGISVYDLGLYIDTLDIPVLNTKLRALQIDSEEKLIATLMNPVKGAEFMDTLDTISFSIRIMPVRNTDVAHMRDGFVRGITARHDPDEQTLQAFKEFFPNPRKSFNKEQVMLLTCWKGQKLDLDIDNHDYGTFSAHGDEAKRLLRAFFATYVSGSKVACEPVRKEFIEQIVHEAF